MKKYKSFITITLLFYLIAVVLWLATGEIFYLYNFIIIGTALGLGMGLWPVFPKNKKNKARLISQALVGGYMFFGLGCGLIYMMFGYIMPENMQIEGFWLWLLSGVFMAGVIHYAIAKIIGPLIFNRAWCGWACWTAAILDILPWKVNKIKRPLKYRRIRYIHFALSATVVFVLFFGFKYGLPETLRQIDLEQRWKFSEVISIYFSRIPELWWFLGGNILYYAVGIGLAFVLKDNRAFCKYLCPIPVFMKVGSKRSLLKVDKTDEECIDCKLCEKRCPMDIEIMGYINSGHRVNSSECILCQTCVDVCPKNALGLTWSSSGHSKN
ncbi:MAG: 4Fe-4S binding protein [Tannerella sp.]|jgi:polyferredoxin|nr:4Fe-4S binding protein [Tannerella sp.]